ncbi:cache domain-containing protein, partial [Bacillus sp. SS-TM]
MKKTNFLHILFLLWVTQVIGVYFVRELEKSLVQGFRDSLTQQTNLLSYNLKQEFKKSYTKAETESTDETIKTSIRKFASDQKKVIQEVSVFDSHRKLLAISDESKQNKVNRTSTDIAVQRVLVQKKPEVKIEKDGSTGHRVQVMLTPILDDNGKDALGVIYIVASMEDVYKQMKDINQ